MYTLSTNSGQISPDRYTKSRKWSSRPPQRWVGTGCLCVGTAWKRFNGTSEPLWRQKRHQHVLWLALIYAQLQEKWLQKPTFPCLCDVPTDRSEVGHFGVIISHILKCSRRAIQFICHSALEHSKLNLVGGMETVKLPRSLSQPSTYNLNWNLSINPSSLPSKHSREIMVWHIIYKLPHVPPWTPISCPHVY